MGKIWDMITKKQQEEPATIKEIEQLKLNLEREKIKSEIIKIKQSKPKSGLGKIWSAIHDETP